MNNADVQQELGKCASELAHVKTLVDSQGITSGIVPYLTKYAVIRACGVIEQSFKAVVADFCAHQSNKQVKRFLERRVRDGSANPSYANMLTLLKDFDEDWNKKLKAQIELEPNKANLLTSLQSLVDARNDFAHGGNPTASISDVLQYFSHATRIVELIDDVVT